MNVDEVLDRIKKLQALPAIHVPERVLAQAMKQFDAKLDGSYHGWHDQMLIDLHVQGTKNILCHGIPLGCYGVGITTVFHTGMQTMNNSYEYAAAACTGPPTLPYQTWVSAATAGDALIECQALIPSSTSAVLLSLTPVVADAYQCV